MKKTSSMIVFTTLLALGLSLESWCASVFPIHAQIALMDQKEQETIVIKTMETIVEMEAQYEREIVTQGFDWRRFQKYTSTLNKLKHLMLPNAYAAAPFSATNDWKKRGEQFSSLMTQGNRCIYAGWVSTIEGSYCVHPTRSKSAAVRDAYKSNTQCGGGFNQIACNPLVFGYKSLSTGSLFCVPAGINHAHNSSALCMQKALQEKGQKEGDTAERRLNFLVDQTKNSASTSIVEEVHTKILEACVCQDKAEKINKNYHNYMRPHRTCYGLIRAIKGYGKCSINSASGVFNFLETFEKSNEQLLKGLPNKDYDIFYSNFLKDQGLTNSSDYKKLCHIDPSVPIETSPDTEMSKKLSCSSSDCVKIDNEFQCKIIIKNENKEIFTKNIKVTSLDQKYKYNHEGTDLECDLNLKKEDDKKSCTIKIEAAKDGKTATATAKSEGTELKDLQWTSGNDKGTDKSFNFSIEKKSNAVVKLTAKTAKDEELSCEETWNAGESEDDAPTLSVKKTNETSTGIVVEATAKPNSNGHTIVWYRNAPKDLKFTDTDPVPAENSPVAGLDEDKTEATPQVPGEFSRGQTQVTSPKLQQDYDVCAKLVSNSDQNKEVPGGCVTVPKLEMPKPTPPMNTNQSGGQFPQQQSPLIRGGANTATGGIK